MVGCQFPRPGLKSRRGRSRVLPLLLFGSHHGQSLAELALSGSNAIQGFILSKSTVAEVTPGTRSSALRTTIRHVVQVHACQG